MEWSESCPQWEACGGTSMPTRPGSERGHKVCHFSQMSWRLTGLAGQASCIYQKGITGLLYDKKEYLSCKRLNNNNAHFDFMWRNLLTYLQPNCSCQNNSAYLNCNLAKYRCFPSFTNKHCTVISAFRVFSIDTVFFLFVCFVKFTFHSFQTLSFKYVTQTQLISMSIPV